MTEAVVAVEVDNVVDLQRFCITNLLPFSPITGTVMRPEEAPTDAPGLLAVDVVPVVSVDNNDVVMATPGTLSASSNISYPLKSSRASVCDVLVCMTTSYLENALYEQ